MTEFERAVAERLLSYCRRADGCLIWTRGINEDGYGIIRISNRQWTTHRLIWLLQKGDIPAEMCVLHRCDTPRCVEIDHLFLGTRIENNADRDAKGRGRGGSLPGSAHPHAALTEQAVREILRDDRLHREIADSHGVTPQAVWLIKAGKRWKHVNGGS